MIRVDLQISRDIPILRACRIKNGPQVKKTHPILGKIEMLDEFSFRDIWTIKYPAVVAWR